MDFNCHGRREGDQVFFFFFKAAPICEQLHSQKKGLVTRHVFFNVKSSYYILR